jgi:RimJ/RimL family protein N-acetyltransferase
VDSQLIGMLGIQRERPEKLAHKAFVWGMFVAPSYRQAGIGRALLSGAITRAAGMAGIRQINLGVNANNLAALSLYERCGFKPFGTEREFMLLDGEPHDEVLMVHRLAVT